MTPINEGGSSRAGLARIALPTAAVAIGLLALWWIRGRERTPATPPTRLAVSVPSFGGASTALQRQLALTPDGSTLFYAAIAPDGENRTMRLALHDTQSTVVPGVPPQVANYVVSPDGREFLGAVAYSAFTRYSTTDGSATPLPAVRSGATIAWGRDGSLWVSGATEETPGITRVAADGAVTRPFGDRHADLSIQQLLPGDRWALCVRQPAGVAAGPVLLLDLRSGETELLLSDLVTEVRYTVGHLVLAMQAGTLEAIPFDASRRRILGDRVRIASGISMPGSGIAQVAVSENGTVAYVPDDARSLTLVDRNGSTRPAVAARRNFHAPAFSPDGRRIATDFSTADGRDVWTVDLASGSLARATFVGDGHDATWTPDGARLTFISVHDGVLTLFAARPGDPQSRDSLLASSLLGYSGIWLPDGAGLLTFANGLDSASGGDIGMIRGFGRGPLEPMVSTRFDERQPAISADGRWMAFTSSQSGRNEIYVRRLDGAGELLQVSVAGGVEPVFSKRGSELFYRAGGGAGTHLVAAQLALSTRATVTGRTTLFPVGGYATGTPHSNYDVSPDGRTFAFVGFNQAARVMIIQNLPALVEALRARDTRSR